MKAKEQTLEPPSAFHSPPLLEPSHFHLPALLLGAGFLIGALGHPPPATGQVAGEGEIDRDVRAGISRSFALRRDGPDLTLTCPPCPHHEYTVMQSSDLSTWQVLPDGPGDSGSIRIRRNGPSRFFRLKAARSGTPTAEDASTEAVYSASTVGFVTITLSAGYCTIGNPLQAENDLLNTILPLGDRGIGVTIIKADPYEGYTTLATYFGPTIGWFPATTTLEPFEGAFIDVPPSAAPLEITFVGEVREFPLSTDRVKGGGAFNLLASPLAVSWPLGSPTEPATLEFPAATGDTVYLFDCATKTFLPQITYFGAATGWFPPPPEGPTIPVATGFFVQKSGADTPWQIPTIWEAPGEAR